MSKYKEAEEAIKTLFEDDNLEFYFKGRIGGITAEFETPNFKKKKRGLNIGRYDEVFP